MSLFKKSLPVLGLLAGAHAAPAAPSKTFSNGTINWVPCPDAISALATLPIECSSHGVPLDYTNKNSSETVDLPLLRLPATKKPTLGSIILNFGGPGLTATTTLAQAGSILNMWSGGQYDLVAFDPRGTSTALTFDCFTSPITAQQLSAYSAFFPRPDEREAMGKLWAATGIISDTCAATLKGNGTLVGTAFTARDVVALSEALGQKDKIRYWGFSYGTTLGATLVSMFPEKIEGVILDGVQNPHEYYHADADYQEWTQSDEVFSGIFEHCIKNADKCAFAHRGKTAADLEEIFWSFYDYLRYNPIGLGTTIIDHYFLIGQAAEAIHGSNLWPDFTKALDMIMGPPEKYDPEFLAGFIGAKDAPNPIAVYGAELASEALLGIHCSDRVNRISTLKEYFPVQERLRNISRLMGGTDAPISMGCAQWKFDAKERYCGDFKAESRKPVLLVGNTFDGHTPIVSARNVSSGFNNSAVLEVRGYGHSSIGLPSACTVQKFSSYWVNGTIPQNGTACEVDAKPFSGVTWGDVAKQIGWPWKEEYQSTSSSAVSRSIRRGF